MNRRTLSSLSAVAALCATAGTSAAIVHAQTAKKAASVGAKRTAPAKKPAKAAAAAMTPVVAPQTQAEMDKPVKDFVLTDVTAARPTPVKLSSYKGKKHVVAVWMSYNCSVTHAYEERLGKLLQTYGAPSSDIAFVAVHANMGETDDRIKRYAQDKNFTGPVLNDKVKNPGMTEYFQVRATPTVVIIDKKGVLRFKGRIDNDPSDRRGENPETKKLVVAALTSIQTGKEIAIKTSPTPG